MEYMDGNMQWDNSCETDSFVINNTFIRDTR
jgi:hypothetical protein